MRFEKKNRIGLTTKFLLLLPSFMRAKANFRLDPEFIHSGKSNEGEKFTTKWPVNF